MNCMHTCEHTYFLLIMTHLPRAHTRSPSVMRACDWPAAMLMMGGSPMISATKGPPLCLSPGGCPILPHTTTLPCAVRAMQKVPPACRAIAPPFSCSTYTSHKIGFRQAHASVSRLSGSYTNMGTLKVKLSKNKLPFVQQPFLLSPSPTTKC